MSIDLETRKRKIIELENRIQELEDKHSTELSDLDRRRISAERRLHDLEVLSSLINVLLAH